MPRHAAAIASSVYAIATLLLAWPALLGRFLVTAHSDQYIAGFAFREFAAASLKAGEGIPLWNPFLHAGMPYVAAMHGDIFYPTFLLRLLMPTDVAMTWGFVIHVFLAGLFTFCFLRSMGIGFFGALLGGLVYLMSGPVAGLVSPGHDGKLFVQTMLPLSLWMLGLGIRRGVPWSWGVLAVAIGLGVLSPHPQLLQYMLLACGAFALWLAFGQLDGVGVERPLAFRRLGYALGSVLLGGLMGAVQYLPVRQYVDWSPRAGGKGWEHAVSYSMPPEELVSTYLPHFSGLLDSYWGRNGIHFHSEYFGAAALVLAAAGLLWADRRGGRSFVWFWAGVFVVSLLWTLGGYTPFYRLVYAIVPGTQFFRAPSTMMFVPMFSVAVFAALGAERLLGSRVSGRFVMGTLAAAGFVALLASSGGLSNLAMTLAPQGREELVRANEGALMLGGWRSFLFVALAGAVWFLVTRRRVGLTVSGILLAVVVAADFWSVLRHYWEFVPGAESVYSTDPAIDFIRQDDAHGRVYARQLTYKAAWRDPFLEGDALMIHRVRHVAGYHGNELGRYQQLSGLDQAHLPAIALPGLRSMLNVRYIYSDASPADRLERFGLDATIADVAPGARHVLGPVPNAAGSQVHLYRFDDEMSPAWVASRIVKAPDEAVLGTIYNRLFTSDVLRQVALFADDAPIDGADEVTSLPPPSPIRTQVTRSSHGRINVRLDSPAPAGSALVVSENYYPGWQATVGGRDVPTARVNYTLIGVQLPEGATEVDLAFASAPYRHGRTVTIIALVAAVILVVAGGLTSRRRPVAVA
jgi:hypothetical protein